MRPFSFLSLAALALLASANDTSDVLSLVASDFEAKVNPESLILVEFFVRFASVWFWLLC